MSRLLDKFISTSMHQDPAYLAAHDALAITYNDSSK